MRQELADENNILIRIEIETADKDEIKQIASVIDKAEQKLHGIKSSRTAKAVFESEYGAPIHPGEEEREGPIFRGEEEPEAISHLTRSGKGRAAIQRQDIFKNINNRIDDLESNQTTILEELQSFGLPAAVALGTGGMKGWLFSAFKSFLPEIATVFFTAEIVNGWLERAEAAGGWIDRRFKRIIRREVDDKTSRETKEALREGFQMIRMSSWIGPRGTTIGQVGTFRGQKAGVIFAQTNLERLEKGIYL